MPELKKIWSIIIIVLGVLAILFAIAQLADIEQGYILAESMGVDFKNMPESAMKANLERIVSKQRTAALINIIIGISMCIGGSLLYIKKPKRIYSDDILYGKGNSKPIKK